MQLLILRVVFMLVAIGIATLLVTSPGFVELDNPPLLPAIVFLGTLALAGATIAADIWVARKPIDVSDARIPDLVESSVLAKQLIMPRFVLSELQGIADSSDKLRRARGRRGLDILNRLRNNENIDLKIYDRELPEMDGQAVDMKLVLLAKHLEGKIVTGDYNLNKVARLHNVDVINLNDIANSLKPVFLLGEVLTVRIVKPGEEVGQGIGYLDDGTMIVVEAARAHIGKEVTVNVTSVLQTSAGRMIFGKYGAVPPRT